MLTISLQLVAPEAMEPRKFAFGGRALVNVDMPHLTGNKTA